MPTKLDRLRRLHGVKKYKKPEPTLPPTIEQKPSRAATSLEECVAGQELHNDYGSCYMSTHTYPLHHRRGSSTLGDLLCQHPISLNTFYPGFNLSESVDFRQALFIDTETTGLGGGAGIYCFMVGIGTFEKIYAKKINEKRIDEKRLPTPIEKENNLQPPDPAYQFVIRQFFMRNPAEEAALLVALAEFLNQKSMLISFNGRSFDLPLLRTRFNQNKHILSDAYHQLPLLGLDAPHLDILHPARRMWRRRLKSCRLGHLEEKILNIQRAGEDVPGHLIPQLYTDYRRSGDAGEMQGIFYHNREDIISMVPLAEYLSGLLADDGYLQPDHKLPGLDWLALGTFCEDAGRWQRAESAYKHALALIGSVDAKAEAFSRLGQLQKRQERWQEATETWQHWLSTVSDIDPAPYVELAKYCEWQAKDLEQAEMWAAWALHNQKTAPAWQHSPSVVVALEHRLARLKRKRAG